MHHANEGRKARLSGASVCVQLVANVGVPCVVSLGSGAHRGSHCVRFDLSQAHSAEDFCIFPRQTYQIIERCREYSRSTLISVEVKPCGSKSQRPGLRTRLGDVQLHTVGRDGPVGPGAGDVDGGPGGRDGAQAASERPRLKTATDSLADSIVRSGARILRTLR